MTTQQRNEQRLNYKHFLERFRNNPPEAPCRRKPVACVPGETENVNPQKAHVDANRLSTVSQKPRTVRSRIPAPVGSPRLTGSLKLTAEAGKTVSVGTSDKKSPMRQPAFATAPIKTLTRTAGASKYLAKSALSDTTPSSTSSCSSSRASPVCSDLFSEDPGAMSDDFKPNDQCLPSSAENSDDSLHSFSDIDLDALRIKYGVSREEDSSPRKEVIMPSCSFEPTMVKPVGDTYHPPVILETPDTKDPEEVIAAIRQRYGLSNLGDQQQAPAPVGEPQNFGFRTTGAVNPAVETSDTEEFLRALRQRYGIDTAPTFRASVPAAPQTNLTSNFTGSRSCGAYDHTLLRQAKARFSPTFSMTTCKQRYPRPPEIALKAKDLDQIPPAVTEKLCKSLEQQVSSADYSKAGISVEHLKTNTTKHTVGTQTLAWAVEGTDKSMFSALRHKLHWLGSELRTMEDELQGL
ncbi:hypothetical protein DFJ77DRAFT_542138 [Powellomyces hirtus]|nr:hypothetical protein DFJ77DRAFT_542138 [Powellomyces hirtus]